MKAIQDSTTNHYSPSSEATVYVYALETPSITISETAPTLTSGKSWSDIGPNILVTNKVSASVNYAISAGSATTASSVDWTGVENRPTSLPADGGNADTVDNLHASAFTRSKYNGCSDSKDSMTTCTDLSTWISRLESTGIISVTSSISTGAWWWTRSVNFQVNDWNISTSGAMIIHSGNGDSSNKNYKHFLVLDAYGDLYGITSNLDWEKYTKFVKTSDLPTKVSQLTNDAGYKTTDTTYSTATSNTLGLVKIGYAANGKNYPV
ncbi:MAG: hypothetical protein PUG15_09560 [Bacteroidales bacterium]|nr:hypothetical protein [Bacteroidales bacterium]